MGSSLSWLPCNRAGVPARQATIEELAATSSATGGRIAEFIPGEVRLTAFAVMIVVTGAAVAGAVLGGRLAGRVSPEHLRRGFGWFVLAGGTLILIQEAPGDLVPQAGGHLGSTVTAAGPGPSQDRSRDTEP